MTTTDREPRESRLLIPAKEAAAMVGKSLRTWRTWDAAGLIPQAIQISRSRLWRIAELKAWIAAGCPPRRAWEFTETDRRRGS